jgi:restriction system protein
LVDAGPVVANSRNYVAGSHPRLVSWSAQTRDRRHLIEWTSDLRLLTPEEFEWLVGEVFHREGWKVRETGRQDAPDGNIDLELMRQGQRVIVQCKRWKSWQVGVKEVREFAGTLMREGLPPNAGVFVTLSDFTPQARAEGEKIGITLVDNRDLYARIEKVRRSELCLICGKPMILARRRTAGGSGVSHLAVRGSAISAATPVARSIY